MEIVAVRIPHVYGPGAKIGAYGCNLICTQGGIGEPVQVMCPSDQWLCLAHVDDIAEVIVRLLLADRIKRDLYQIGGRATTFEGMAAIGKQLVPGMEISFGNAHNRLPVQIDNSKLMEDLGFEHRTIKEGFLGLMNSSRREVGLPPLPDTLL